MLPDRGIDPLSFFESLTKQPQTMMSNYRVSTRLDGDEWVATMDVQGYDKESLSVERDGENIIVKGKQETVSDGHFGKMRTNHSLKRTLDVPDGCIIEEASAEYKNGVLTITIPIDEEEFDDVEQIEIE